MAESEPPHFIIDTRTGEKPEWTPLEEHELHKMFEGVYNYVEDQDIDNVQWERLNFKLYDADYYRDKYGDKFPEEWYELMAKSTEEDNKIEDYRQHSLKIEKKEVTINFE